MAIRSWRGGEREGGREGGREEGIVSKAKRAMVTTHNHLSILHNNNNVYLQYTTYSLCVLDRLLLEELKATTCGWNGLRGRWSGAC